MRHARPDVHTIVGPELRRVERQGVTNGLIADRQQRGKDSSSRQQRSRFVHCDRVAGSGSDASFWANPKALRRAHSLIGAIAMSP
jgi:hypothetical protein